MSASVRTVAQEVELARLIDAQEKDDTTRVWSREVSLDATLVHGEDFSLLDVIGEEDERLLDLVGDNETFVRLVSGGPRVTDEDVKFWRYLRVRQGWTFNQIAQHAGVHRNTVYAHISPRSGERVTEQTHALGKMHKRAVRAYAAGAKLIEVAEVLYEDAGYKTPESCYQALRRLFLRRGQVIRPKSWKHGKRSRSASRETYIAYWKEQNRKARERKLQRLTRCERLTREGRRCSRWAREGTSYCNVHSGLQRPTIWKSGVVLDALNTWKREHGEYPRPRDWTHASVSHPNFKTVYGLFPSWQAALSAATSRPVFARHVEAGAEDPAKPQKGDGPSAA